MCANIIVGKTDFGLVRFDLTQLTARLNLVVWRQEDLETLLAMAKLYRTQMAELAGMTTAQLDYFIRLGALAPDLGEVRKYYSAYEAALVLIAGQLMPQFKDQRAIAEVLSHVRSHTRVPRIEQKSYRALYRARIEEEWRESGEACDDAALERRAATYFIVSKGFVDDLHKGGRPYDRQLKFMKFYCAREGLDFGAELTRARERVSRISEEPEGVYGRSFHNILIVMEYFQAIGGRADYYLQCGGNGDGSVETRLDTEPIAFPSRISWITLNLGKLFKRLGPYVDKQFVSYASDYLKEHGCREFGEDS